MPPKKRQKQDEEHVIADIAPPIPEQQNGVDRRAGMADIARRWVHLRLGR